MKTTQYLYNIDPKILKDMPYEEAILLKLSSAKILISQLLEPHYSVRDEERIAAVGKAESFSKKALKELE